MSQVDSHCCKASRSFCKILVSSELLIFRHSRQSSANNHAVADISSVAKKANNNRAFLSRNISSCPKKIKAQCYLTLVRPIMEYACVVWDPITQKNITELERVQRKAARFVMGDYKTTSSVRSMSLLHC
jgi:hypothetical protein